MTTPDIAAVMAQAMDAEDRRRELASRAPGLGAAMQLPDPPAGPAVGKWDLGLPVVGESHQAAPDEPQHKSYGPPSPVYADPVVGGLDYAPGAILTALRAAGERAFAAQDAPVVEVVSPEAAPRQSLLGKLLGRFRHR